MEYLADLVTTVPEGTSPAKVDELRAAEAVRLPADFAKQAVWYGSGVLRSVRANCTAFGCFTPPAGQSFPNSSPRYPFIGGEGNH